MFTQPSVNQIASAYQGNPASLSAKVDQDKKQHGGIPQDLRQLMALNDITEGRNAVANQQALGVPTNMPTIAQSLQERARQALQARMMQQQQEQQRKNGMPMMVPQGTPRPPMQPQAQGLDSLQSNVGQGYANGGIIRFADVDGEQEVPAPSGSWFERLISQNLSPAERRRKVALEAQAEINRSTPTKANLEREAAMAQVNRPNPNITEEVMKRLGIGTAKEEPTQQVVGATPPAPAPSTLTQRVSAQTSAPAAPRPAPATGGYSILDELKNAGLLNMPIDDAARKKIQADMNLSPEEQERLAIEKFNKQVGQKDLSVYDKMAAELAARKERLNAPKPGIEGLLDYLSFVAQSGGRTRGEAGAKAAAAMQARNLSREEQQAALMEKILELGQKKTEAEYGQKEKMYDIGQARYKEVYKNAHDAAKELFKSDEEARKLGLEAVMKQKELDNRLLTAKISASASGRDNLMERARALMAVDKTLTLDKAMERAAAIAATGQITAAETRANTAADATRAKIREKYAWIDMLPANDPTKKAMAAERDRALAAVGGGGGLSNAVPSTGGPTSSNVRSQADAIISGGR